MPPTKPYKHTGRSAHQQSWPPTKCGISPPFTLSPTNIQADLHNKSNAHQERRISLCTQTDLQINTSISRVWNFTLSTPSTSTHKDLHSNSHQPKVPNFTPTSYKHYVNTPTCSVSSLSSKLAWSDSCSLWNRSSSSSSWIEVCSIWRSILCGQPMAVHLIVGTEISFYFPSTWFFSPETIAMHRWTSNLSGDRCRPLYSQHLCRGRISILCIRSMKKCWVKFSF